MYNVKYKYLPTLQTFIFMTPLYTPLTYTLQSVDYVLLLAICE